MVKASILLLTYNQEKFIADALNSILDQDYENIEIIISDDNSQDKTWQIIQEITSNHPKKSKVIFNKNVENLGVVGNYYKAFNLSSGDVIFTAAGDDISLPNRCSKSIEFWLFHNKPSLVAADGYDMDIDGTILGTKETDNLEKWDLKSWHSQRPYFFGASHMMTRELINLNKLNPKLPYEDQCFVLRAILKKSIFRLPTPLVKHRRGGLSQPTSKVSQKSKKMRLLKGVNEGLLELNQMLEDADYLGDKQPLFMMLKSKYFEYQYAFNTLTSEKKIDAIKTFLITNNVRISKKIRYLNYSIFPSIMENIDKFKKAIRHVKK